MHLLTLTLALALSLTLSRCTFCPCGAVRFSLHGATLRVNGREVMVPHRNLMCQWLQPSVPVVCNLMCQGLQPSVPVAATLCAGSCNSPSVRHGSQAAALPVSVGGCSPTSHRQVMVLQLAES